MTTPPRVIAYTRQSVGRTGEDADTSLSLSAQLDRIVSYCAREGWEIVDTIADHDLSGERWDRPGIQSLMDRVRQGGIDRVVVFSISRIARKVLHQEMVMDVLTEHGAQLVSVTEAGLDNILVRVVHAGMAEQHNVNHRKILRATFEARARRGLHHGPAPFGYRTRDGDQHKGLDIVDEEAALVVEAFRRRADGESIKAIANWINESGAAPRFAASWSDVTVRSMLTCPTYAGYAIYRKSIVGDLAPGVAEPIIDRAVWHQVQRALDTGGRMRKAKAAHRSWLEGLVWHGCGSRMSTYETKVTNPGNPRINVGFRCNRALSVYAKRCPDTPRGLLIEGMEQAALACITADLATVPTDPHAVVAARAAELGVPSAVKQRDRLERQRAALLDQIARAEQLVTSGRRDFVWFDAFDRDAQERIAALDAQIAALSDVPTADDIEDQIATIARLVPNAALLALFPDNARAAIAALGRVVFHAGTVRIDYADEFRHLFPRPAVAHVTFDQSVKRWNVSVVTDT